MLSIKLVKCTTDIIAESNKQKQYNQKVKSRENAVNSIFGFAPQIGQIMGLTHEEVSLAVETVKKDMFPLEEFQSKMEYVPFTEEMKEKFKAHPFITYGHIYSTNIFNGLNPTLTKWKLPSLSESFGVTIENIRNGYFQPDWELAYKTFSHSRLKMLKKKHICNYEYIIMGLDIILYLIKTVIDLPENERKNYYIEWCP